MRVSSDDTSFASQPGEGTTNVIILAKVNAILPLERRVKGLLRDRPSVCLHQFTTEFEATLYRSPGEAFTLFFCCLKAPVASPACRHLSFSNDGGAKRLGGEALRVGVSSLLEMCPVPCQRENGSSSAPTFLVYPPVCLFLHRLPLFTPPFLNLYPYLCCCGDQFG